jgi:diaminohydroxyphosphoribosylaminopyrimidine deaminase/5-amino-6-(5-phosphoribosylamino)uracil reductase
LLRVILDSRLSISRRARIVKAADEDLLVFTNQREGSQRARFFRKEGVEVVFVNSVSRGLNLEDVLSELGRRDILSVLLEAGPTLNGAALAAGIVHKLVLFYAPKIAGENRVPFALAPNLKLSPLQDIRTQQFGPDVAVEAYLQNVYR